MSFKNNGNRCPFQINLNGHDISVLCSQPIGQDYAYKNVMLEPKARFLAKKTLS